MSCVVVPGIMSKIVNCELCKSSCRMDADRRTPPPEATRNLQTASTPSAVDPKKHNRSPDYSKEAFKVRQEEEEKRTQAKTLPAFEIGGVLSRYFP